MRTRSFRVLSVFIAFFILTISLESQAASALWIAESKGVIKVATADGAILFEIPDANGIDGVAVDNANGRVWSWGNQRLKAYSANGVVQVNQFHSKLPRKDKPVDMLADSEGVWLAIDKELFRFDGQGALKKSIRFKHEIRTLTLDSKRNRLWLAVPGTVFIVDSEGRDLKQFRTHFLNIEQLEYDAGLDQTWVVVEPFVLRLDAKTLHIQYVSDFGVGFRLKDHASADGQGGLWGAEDKLVSHLHADGELDVRIKPFADNNSHARLQDLAADIDNGSVWVASRTTLKHYNLAGAQQKEFIPDFGDGVIRSINRMALAESHAEAPVLRIVVPANGGFINSNRPIFDLEYTSSGTVDIDSIEIKHNNILLNTDCTADQNTAQCDINTVLDEGEITLTATIANDDGQRSAPATVTFTVDTLAPVIFISLPQDGLITNNPALTLVGNVDEPLDSLILNHNGSISPLTLINNNFSRSLSLSEGVNTLTVSAADFAGNTDSQTVSVLLDTGIPTIPDLQQITLSNSIDGMVTVMGANNSVEANSRVTITNTRTGVSITVTADANGAFAVNIIALANDVLTITVADTAGNTSEMVSTTVSNLPPDPSTIAPPLNPTQITPLLDAVSFLYSGNNPIQTGVQPGTIEARRVAVIRGKVLDKQNNPLHGVTVTVKDHAEFGKTISRADGMFDLVVNGGGVLTLNYRKDDYLPVQRQVSSPWQDYIYADDIVMIGLDPQVTTIDLNSAQAIQVAQGTPQTDEDGTRQATLLFPQGTTATITLPDGTQQQLTTLSVRATEYTVGDNGFESMPAPLPATSAYTYAVELSVDEAIANGVKRNGVDVAFNQPVPFYVDNFLNFPTGEAVPVGYYNGDQAAWIPYNNGRIVEIMGIENGMAVLDVNGEGSPASAAELQALDISDAERTSLTQLYEPGKSLWRVALTHLSTWDCNWPYGPPDDAEPPPDEQPETPDEDQPDDTDDENECDGCVISPQAQTVGEEIPVTATPYSLHYRSDRVPGRKGKNSVTVPVSGATLPGSLQRIFVTVEVAGQRLQRDTNLQTGRRDTFEWDGLDGFGREIYGAAAANITVAYVYRCVYRRGNGFARYSKFVEPIGTRNNCRSVTLSRRSRVMLVSPLIPPVVTVNGWSLSVHHAWAAPQGRLYTGDGGYRTVFPSTIHTIAGNGGAIVPNEGGMAIDTGLSAQDFVATDAVGNLYIRTRNGVHRINPEGIINLIAGNNVVGFGGDGGPALQARVNDVRGVALDVDGNLYMADTGNRRIRRVGVNGIITTIAGSGASGFSGDNGPATQAALTPTGGLAVDARGNLYIADGNNNRIRMVTPDGIITTVAGTGTTGFSGDGGLATQAAMTAPHWIALDKAGNLYMSTNQRIRKVTPGGIITTIAGTGLNASTGDGGPAIQARLSNPRGIVVDDVGNLYIITSNRIRKVSVDGIINTIAGTGVPTFSGDGGPASLAGLSSPSGVAFDPQGNLYVADGLNDRIRKIPRAGLFQLTEAHVASEDGSQLFVFDIGGRHLRTINALTGAIEYSFGRDAQGRLISVTDVDGDITTIERNSNGMATAIVAPDGQRMGLTVDAKGYLATATNPATEVYTMGYTADGLLTSYRDRRNQLSTYQYDDRGRLIRDTNPGNGGWILNRAALGQGYSTTMTTAEGRQSSFTVEPQINGDRLQVNTLTDGTIQQKLFKLNAQEITTQPDGTVITLQENADPRFGMQSPVPSSTTVRVPSGLTSTTTVSRAAILSNPADPLSLQSLTEIESVNGRAFQADYNATTQTSLRTSAAGRTSTQTLNDEGRPVNAQITGLAPVGFSYNSRGRLATILQNDGAEQRLTQMSYYASGPQAGFLQSITDAENRSLSFEYDNAGRVTKQTLPDNRIIQYGYDASGNVTSIIPPGRPAHVFNYNAFDLEGRYTPPVLPDVAQPATVYDYNLDKELVRITRPDDQEINFTYNTGAQLTSLAIPGGSYSYTYIPTSGQLDTVTSPDNVVLDYSYDGFLLTSQAWSGAIAGSVMQAYDNSFRMNTQSINGASTITFQYDNDSLLTQAGSLTIFRDSQKAGLITGTLQGSVTTSQTYNVFGELSNMDTDINSADIYGVSYARDKLGRITQKTEVIEGQTVTEIYGYDTAGRLETVNRNGVLTTYAYDSNGNRLSKTTGSAVESGVYDAQDRLLSYDGCDYQYTANGELTSKTCGNETTTYSYDVLGNLHSAVIASGATQSQIEYLVDGQNRRVGKNVNGVRVQGFLYQNQLEPVAELDGSNQVVARFVYGTRNNVPDYMIKGGITYRIISDHLGGPRLVINITDGSVAQRIDYDEFGHIISDTNPGFQPFGFAGGVYDQHTKLARFGARDYDARAGRWTLKDPIRFNGGDTNLFGYVLNDPINLIDPNGEVALVTAIAFVVVVAIIATNLMEHLPKAIEQNKEADDLNQEMSDALKRGDLEAWSNAYSESKKLETQILGTWMKIMSNCPGTSATPGTGSMVGDAVMSAVNEVAETTVGNND